MIEFITDWLVQTWDIVLDSGTYLLAGFACAGLLYLLMPTEKVVAHLGQPGMGAVVKASLVGIPLPLCSCSVIPVASSGRRRSARAVPVASVVNSRVVPGFSGQPSRGPNSRTPPGPSGDF